MVGGHYPHLGGDGVFVGEMKAKIFAIHTLQDLQAGVPFAFAEDYDPRTGGSSWQGMTMDGEEFGSA